MDIIWMRLYVQTFLFWIHQVVLWVGTGRTMAKKTNRIRLKPLQLHSAEYYKVSATHQPSLISARQSLWHIKRPLFVCWAKVYVCGKGPVCRQFIFAGVSCVVILCDLQAVRVHPTLSQSRHDQRPDASNEAGISGSNKPSSWGEDGDSCRKLISGLEFNLLLINDKQSATLRGR